MQLNLGGIQEYSYRSENVYSHKEYRWGWAHLNDGEAVLGIMGGNIKDTDTIDVTIYDSYLFCALFFCLCESNVDLLIETQKTTTIFIKSNQKQIYWL